MGAAHTAEGVPIVLAVAGQRAVVVGGSDDAAAIASALLDFGAHVTVVGAPVALPPRDLETGTRAELISRGYVRGDLAGAMLAVCLEGGEVADAVSAEAAATGCLVCVPGRPDISTFRFADGFVPSPDSPEESA